MASKTKDFSSVNTEDIYNQIDQATGTPAVKVARKPRKEARTVEEIQAVQMAGKTRGRKGTGLPRINMAFRPDVYEYIEIMARVSGQTLTDFVNNALLKSMENNADLYEKAKAFRNELK